MASIGPEVEFGADFVGLKRIEEMAAVAVGEAIVGRVAEESGWAAGARDQSRTLVVFEEIGRIDEGAEVGAAGASD